MENWKLKTERETGAATALRKLKAGIRMDPISRANLTFDLILTNKSQTLLANEYGVHKSNVSRISARIRECVRRGAVRVRFYRKNGVPMFWLEGGNGER